MYELLDLRFRGLYIEEAARTYEAAFGRVTTKALRPSYLIFSSDLGPRPVSLRVQSVYSFLLACIGFVLVSPIMLLVAFAVRVTSRGPVLFRQTRVGLNGKPFTIYKFRSMRVDAEAETGAVWAVKNDPRVTAIGKYLRILRLDELPQLLNVIRGEMSIVGPRPERPEFVQTLSEVIPFYRQRHSVKPGITGWAQINYKYGETIEDAIVKLEFDLYYIKNLSLSLDMYIIFHTMKAMLVTQVADRTAAYRPAGYQLSGTLHSRSRNSDRCSIFTSHPQKCVSAKRSFTILVLLILQPLTGFTHKGGC